MGTGERKAREIFNFFMNFTWIFAGPASVVAILNVVAVFFDPDFAYNLETKYSNADNEDLSNLLFALFSIIFLLAYGICVAIYIYNKKIFDTDMYIDRLRSDEEKKHQEVTYRSNLMVNTARRDYEHKLQEETQKLEEEKSLYRKRDEKRQIIFEQKNPFKYIASLTADAQLIIFDKCEKYLLHKKKPMEFCGSTHEELKKLKKISKEHVIAFKEMQYKYEYLLSMFPELEQYVSSLEDMMIDIEERTLEEAYDNEDRVRRWVTPEEYAKLSESERNQRALDNYIARKKTKEGIGREYELYCAWVLHEKGWDVEPTGIIKRFEDLGRDLIAKKDGTVWIVQCKYWSQRKEIHENVICQLFGTAKMYDLQHPEETRVGMLTIESQPVLMTNINLTATALDFAKALGVDVKTFGLKDFPRIKCNINSEGGKIYHLPFDQQYDKTKVNKRGECYAWTVKEAETRGFRRAKKWFGTS